MSCGELCVVALDGEEFASRTMTTKTRDVTRRHVKGGGHRVAHGFGRRAVNGALADLDDERARVGATDTRLLGAGVHVHLEAKHG